MFRNRYRIVRDSYCGYEAQVKRWWFPIWMQIYGCNTETTIDKAKVWIERHKGYVVYEE